MARDRLRLVRFRPGQEAQIRDQVIGAALVWNAGVCGGISTHLSMGESVEPGLVFYRQSPAIVIPTGATLSLLTVDDPVLDAETRISLQADVVDMEAYHLAATCQQAGIPFRCTKVVGDTGDTEGNHPSILNACRSVLPDLTKSVEKSVKKLVNLS